VSCFQRIADDSDTTTVLGGVSRNAVLRLEIIDGDA
jgi:hypothetical protein